MGRFKHKWFSRLIVIILFLLSTLSAHAAESAPPNMQPDDPHIYILPETLNSPLNFGVGLSLSDVLDADDRRRLECQKKFCPYDDPYRSDTRAAELSTVLRLAIDRFSFFSGLKDTVTRVERTVNDYSERIMLSGELRVRRLTDNSYEINENINIGAQFTPRTDNLSGTAPAQRPSIANQLAIRNVRWNTGFNVGEREISLNLNLGDAVQITAAGGDDPWVGVLFTFKL